MSNSNLLRRRLMGEISKVSTPDINPESGSYNMLFNSGFQCTISCQTAGSVIHWTVFDDMGNVVVVNNESATGVFTPVSSDQTPNGTIPKRFVSCGIGESRTVKAYATRDHWITSDTAEKHYYSGAKPPTPSIHIYGSTDSYGNYIDTDFGSGGVKCYTPVHAKIFDYVDPEDTSFVTYYTTDGSDPDPSNVGGNNPTKIYDKNIDMVKFTNTGSTFNYYNGIVFDYDYFITDKNIRETPGGSNNYVDFTIKAVTVKNNVSSEIGVSYVNATLSSIKYSIIVHTDEFMTAGKYKNLSTYYGNYISWDWNILDNEIDVNPLNVPDTYGYAVFTYDGIDDFSNSLTVFGDVDDMYRWHPISELPGTTRIELKKFGCLPVTEDFSTRINKFVMHYKVTQSDINQGYKIFIGRKNYTVDSNTSNSIPFMRVYGSPKFLDSEGNVNPTYGMNSGGDSWDYDKPDTTPSDYTPNDRYKAWVYVGKYNNGQYQYNRLSTQSQNSDSYIEQATATVYASKSDLTNVYGSGSSIVRQYQKASTTGTDTTTPYYEAIYLYTPTTAGDYDIIYGYQEQDDYPNPFAFVNSPFSHEQNYQINICPVSVAVTGGMVSIPKFFLSYVSNWIADSGIELLFDKSDFSGFLSATDIEYDGSKTVSSIGDFAFSNIKAVKRNGSTIEQSNIDLSNYKKIDTIGDFVFFNCLNTRWWSTSTIQNTIGSVSLPSSLKEIGRFFCGFNVKSSLNQAYYPCVDSVTFNSINPPELRTAPDTERIDNTDFSNDPDILYVYSANGVVGPNAEKPRKWHYMPFGCFVWNNLSSAIGNLSGIRYGWYKCGINAVKVPDAYVCAYTEKWCYQYSTSNVYDWGYRREKVFKDFLPICISSSETCFVGGHDDSDSPDGSSGKLFTYKEREYDENGIPKPNKMCIAAGNLTYAGSSGNWYINENPWGSMSNSANEGTSTSETRDKFAWATSGNSHGSASFHPYNHSTDANFKDYFAYGLSACNLIGKYSGNITVDSAGASSWLPNNWLPDSGLTGMSDDTNTYLLKDKTFSQGDPINTNDSNYFYFSVWNGSIQSRPKYPLNRSADWGYNKIYSNNTFGNYKSNWWYTPSYKWLEYVIDDRRTRDGYRFVKAKVNGKYGLIVFPDSWSASNYAGLENVNEKYGVPYSSNDISQSDWNSSFKPNGCVFLPATGRVTGSSTDYSDRGYYWTSDTSTSKGYCRALYFNGSYVSGQDSVSIDVFHRNKALNVRLVRPDMEYSELEDAIEILTTTYNVNLNRTPVYGGVTTGGGVYRYGETCTIKAFPNTGYRFVRWKENDTQISTSSVLEIEVTSNRTITAEFEQVYYNVVLESDPSNGGVLTGQNQYTYRQTCTVSATPNSGFTFLRWDDNGVFVSPLNTFNFVVTENRKLTAIFQTNTYYQVTATCDTSKGTVTGSGNYLYGATCTLTASPKTGYEFDCWKNGTGDTLFDNTPYSFTVKESTTITGVFEPKRYTVTVSTTGGGTVSGGGEFEYNTQCTVTATPNSGYQFDGWSDGSQVVSARQNYQFTVTGNVDLRALFSLIPVPQTTTVRLVPSAYGRSNNSYVTVTNPDNMYENTDDSSDVCSIRGRNSASYTYYCYIRGFNISDIPSDATVTSFKVKIKCYRNTYLRQNESTYYLHLCNNTSAITNTYMSEAVTTSSSGEVYEIPTGSLTWANIKQYGTNFGIRVPLRSTSSSRPYLYVYGAELEVTYT